MKAVEGPSWEEGEEPVDPGGTYVLFLRPRIPGPVRVGSLGELELRPGSYAYVGSGFGPGGVKARLRRHLEGADAVHWHVDYLRRRSEPEEAWVTRDPERREHEWAAALAGLPGAEVPLTGFGSSDCSCTAHLFRFGRRPTLERFRRAAARQADGEPSRIRRVYGSGRITG